MAEPLATEAAKDLLAFLALAENEPLAAQAYKDCLKLGTSVIVCHLVMLMPQ
jgi:hypothetical protein